jgi:hypothetical protein
VKRDCLELGVHQLERCITLAASKRGTTSGATTEAAAQGKARRARLSQEDVPAYSLEQALRVPRAIAENYAYKPTRPMNVAGAVGMTPTSGPFRTLTGAAVAYGLTTGAAQAPEIGITPLGMKIVRPTSEGEDVAARRDALLRPKVVGEFLRGYDGAALPSETIAKNVLLERGVPVERLDDVLSLILDGAEAVGFLREYSGKRYVDLAGPAHVQTETNSPGRDAAPAAVVTQPSLPVSASPTPSLTVASGVHINIEIHIAADATSDTIEDIFRNMRRYVLTGDGSSDDDASSAE